MTLRPSNLGLTFYVNLNRPSSPHHPRNDLASKSDEGEILVQAILVKNLIAHRHASLKRTYRSVVSLDFLRNRGARFVAAPHFA
ncbi:hypothetical protein CDAR_547751 [Caerostris darwini]|uniref:Uncharacterized protein n=1 Tax=Caerostris darwini TaxID=1538125 RepID=A0AAV4WH39_9ARAC|nr:hypothetical protein CDAR_547751 [Caerostris darwini]